MRISNFYHSFFRYFLGNGKTPDERKKAKDKRLWINKTTQKTFSLSVEWNAFENKS